MLNMLMWDLCIKRKCQEIKLIYYACFSEKESSLKDCFCFCLEELYAMKILKKDFI